jgi:hypothetical protein
MKIGKRKGRFTVPNLITVAFLLFIFSVFFNPMTSAFPSISSAEGVGQVLSYTVLNTLPAIFLLVILASPFILKEKKKLIRREQGGNPR